MDGISAPVQAGVSLRGSFLRFRTRVGLVEPIVSLARKSGVGIVLTHMGSDGGVTPLSPGVGGLTPLLRYDILASTYSVARAWHIILADAAIEQAWPRRCIRLRSAVRERAFVKAVLERVVRERAFAAGPFVNGIEAVERL